MRRIIAVLAIILIAGIAYARLQPGEYIFTEDSGVGFDLDDYTSGPDTIDLLADGTATVVFFWFEPDDRSTIVRTRPYGDAAIGEGSLSVYNLRANIPRSFDLEFWEAPDGPDSVYVDVGTATEVIMSW